MTASLGDILKLSKSLTASMRQRDASVESSRRLARQSLNRLEACLDASDENVKRPGEGNLNVLAQALPELIVNYPEYRQLYEENRRLYVVVAEQQLTLEMIMQKYRTKMAEVAESGRSRMITQRCLDRNDGVLGMLLHEKGVGLRVMEDSIWEEDDDVATMQHAAQIVAENTTLREMVRVSYQTNGKTYLRPNRADKEIQILLPEAETVPSFSLEAGDEPSATSLERPLTAHSASGLPPVHTDNMPASSDDIKSTV